MQGEIEILQVEKKIRTRVKKQMEKTQKEYYLNEQMQAIQKELGERDEFKNEIQELEEKIKTEEDEQGGAARKVKKELKKLKMMSPMSAEATVVRNYIDWVLALPWDDKTEETLRHQRGREDPRRGPLRPEEGQGAHPRVPRGAGAREEAQGPDPLPRRPARRRQDLARAVDRARDRPQVRAAVARRRARRGRDPRPPPHVHRRAARQDHPVAEEGRLATTRCSCSTRSTRCRPTSAAIPRRRCSRCSIPSRTTRSTITTSISTTTSRDVMFITTANYAARDPAAAAGPHGDHPAPRLHRVREARDRASST